MLTKTLASRYMNSVIIEPQTATLTLPFGQSPLDIQIQRLLG